MRLLAAALILTTMPVCVSAQPASAQTASGAAPAPAALPDLSRHMAPLGWLIGEWQGSGWIMLPDGSRQTFDSHEAVTARLSGNALLVEGRHFASANPTRPMHDAMAMITWDERAQAHRFRSALASGMGGDFPIIVRDNGFSWSMDLPGGRIDYVVEHQGGVWTERGRRTGADGRSVDFFEMSLRRR